jgi:hypothetical protein
MTNLSMSQLLACVLLLTMSLTTSTISAGGVTMRAELTHVDSGRGFTRWELLTRMAARSRARAASLHHRGGGGNYGHAVTAPASPGTVGQPGTEYLIHFAIGTPQPQHVALTLDTGSDLVWTQCEPCNDCFDQPSPYFDPSASKTNRGVPCSDPMCLESNVHTCFVERPGCFYLESYADKSITAGKMVRDTFTFKAAPSGTIVVPNLSFGCGLFNNGVFNTNESGIAGFGRGMQSLPSQLKVGKFSHCFTSMFESGKSSPVLLGTPDDLRAHATGPIQSTPMARSKYNNYYYLLFKGITVGSTRLPVDESVFAIKGDGTGGTIIDSGTGITSFPQAVYDQLVKALASQMRLPVVKVPPAGLEGRLCFSLYRGADEKKVAVPKIVFHLAGADMELPRENYMFVDAGFMCLIMQGSDGDMTTIGNFQQQNMHIVYDVGNNKLFFAPAQCDKL